MDSRVTQVPIIYTYQHILCIVTTRAYNINYTYNNIMMVGVAYVHRGNCFDRFDPNNTPRTTINPLAISIRTEILKHLKLFTLNWSRG